MGDVQADKPQQLGSGTTNLISPGKSNVDVKVAGEPLAFLHPETGTVLLVPAEDSGALLTEHRTLSNAVAEYQSANRAVQLVDEYRLELATGQCKGDPEQAEKVLAWALKWQDDAHADYHKIFEGLDPVSDYKSQGETDTKTEAKSKDDSNTLSGSGKKLVELVALKKESADDQVTKKADDQKGKMEDGAFKKKIATFATSDALVNAGKWPKQMPEKLLYVRSDKIKPRWPKLKDLDATKWHDVCPTNADGKRTIDKKKLQRYVAEQAEKKGVSWLKKLFKDDLEYSKDLTLTKWAENWNQAHVLDQKGKWKPDGTQVADVDLSAKAQLMRFSYGASLDPDLSVVGSRGGVRAEGHAEVNFARADASLELYFPCREGWLWSIKGKDGTDHDLLAVVCKVTVDASGVVGASIAGELSIQVDRATVAESQPKIKGKPGPKGRDIRRQKRAELKKGDEVGVGQLEVGASAFAGAKAEASISGSLQWRDPEDKNKAFVEIAGIKPGVSGMAGVGFSARFQVDYIRGVFHLTADASLCIGIGAEGDVTFAVDVGQLEQFFKCLFFKIAYANFENLNIFTNGGFEAFTKIQTLCALSKTAVTDYFKTSLADLRTEWSSMMAQADIGSKLAQLDPELLKYALPEAKAMIAYQAVQTPQANTLATNEPSAVLDLRSTVLAVFKTANATSELENILQHMSIEGTKKSSDAVMAELERFFEAGATSGGGISETTASNGYGNSMSNLDQVALSGDFHAWYAAFGARLADEVPHGHPLVPPTNVAYEIHSAHPDHPLFTSSGMNAYYCDEA